MILRGEAEPHQIGAYLMLLRYRGEDPAEMTGLVEAARTHMQAGLPPGCPQVDLDWPSYGAGRTRGAPWFLLSALALANAGHRILMHGSNEFTRGTAVTHALQQLGLPVCTTRDQAAEELQTRNFAYLPLSVLSPGLDSLLRLRNTLGLRSPINTAARLLNPFDAKAGVDGVFHPPYIALHLATAAMLNRGRLVVMKGGGGEAERNPAKTLSAAIHAPEGTSDLTFPALPSNGDEQDLVTTWHTGRGQGAITARATIALALLALGRAETPEHADAQADELWSRRLTGNADEQQAL